MKKSGIELIAEERREQLEKHGRTIDYDLKNNQFGQLSLAAEYLITEDPHCELQQPHGWSETLWKKMKSKTELERLIIAGALIAAEIDRLQASGE